MAAVSSCKRSISAGEIFQANLCLRLEADFSGEALGLLGPALSDAQPRFGALVDGILSLSPERFLRRRGRAVQSEPIKGTRPRLSEANGQAQTREELSSSEKDRPST